MGFFSVEVLLHIAGLALMTAQHYENGISLLDVFQYRILALGESTTSLGSSTSIPGAEDAWPKLLENILNQKNLGKRFVVINQGVNGTNSTAILASLKDNIRKYRPHMIITMMGVNDEYMTTFNQEFQIASGLGENNFPIVGQLKAYRFARLVWKQIQSRVKKSSTNIDSKKDVSKEERIQILLERQDEKALEYEIASDSTANLRVALGNVYYNHGKFMEAEKILKEEIEIHPANDFAYFELGNVYWNEHKYELAEIMHKKAISLNPNDPSFYFGLGALYYYWEKWDLAEEFYLKGLTLQPNDVLGNVKLGDLYREQKRYGEAEILTNTAIARNPNAAWPYIEKEKLYRVLGKIEEAYELAKKSLDIVPVLKRNYRQLRDIILAHNIMLVAVQYPVRSIRPLRYMLEDDTRVIFVDNEEIFKEALEKGKYEDYFVDRFGGDFGHATRRGNELLAGNIVSALLSNVFVTNE